MGRNQAGTGDYRLPRQRSDPQALGLGGGPTGQWTVDSGQWIMDMDSEQWTVDKQWTTFPTRGTLPCFHVGSCRACELARQPRGTVQRHKATSRATACNENAIDACFGRLACTCLVSRRGWFSVDRRSRSGPLHSQADLHIGMTATHAGVTAMFSARNRERA
jgi:hypothetical protein